MKTDNFLIIGLLLLFTVILGFYFTKDKIEEGYRNRQTSQSSASLYFSPEVKCNMDTFDKTQNNRITSLDDRDDLLRFKRCLQLDRVNWNGVPLDKLNQKDSSKYSVFGNTCYMQYFKMSAKSFSTIRREIEKRITSVHENLPSNLLLKRRGITDKKYFNPIKGPIYVMVQQYPYYPELDKQCKDIRYQSIGAFVKDYLNVPIKVMNSATNCTKKVLNFDLQFVVRIFYASYAPVNMVSSNQTVYPAAEQTPVNLLKNLSNFVTCKDMCRMTCLNESSMLCGAANSDNIVTKTGRQYKSHVNSSPSRDANVRDPQGRVDRYDFVAVYQINPQSTIAQYGNHRWFKPAEKIPKNPSA